ncbi:hypothetical protein [Rhizobium rhizosphaerae]|uniref:hypothetical protein n=1 Tax=Xaviernesmea rhizosphaerae TaxID=1672749 RepID=UPI0011185216|nr:hypothetical protein [Xaviernesmea rhizosphaerae]
MSDRIVIACLVGCSGAGKTELIGSLPATYAKHSEGYTVHDGRGIAIDNSLHLSKFRYISHWYNFAIKLSLPEQKRARLIVSDRCPYDVGAYVSNGDLFFHLAKECEVELNAVYNVKLIKIYVRADLSTILNRIKSRIIKQPWRLKYHEDDVEFTSNSFSYFERHRNDWDFIIDGEDEIRENTEKLVKYIDQFK